MNSVTSALIEDIRAEFSTLYALGGVVNVGFIEFLIDRVTELVRELASEKDAELLGENYATIVALAFLSLNKNKLTPN